MDRNSTLDKQIKKDENIFTNVLKSCQGFLEKKDITKDSKIIRKYSKRDARKKLYQIDIITKMNKKGIVVEEKRNVYLLYSENEVKQILCSLLKRGKDENGKWNKIDIIHYDEINMSNIFPECEKIISIKKDKMIIRTFYATQIRSKKEYVKNSSNWELVKGKRWIRSFHGSLIKVEKITNQSEI